MAPVPNQMEALARALKAEKSHLGVIMPNGVSKVAPRAHPTAQGLPGKVLRRVDFYVTVFIRSLKQWPLDGDFLRLDDWLEAALRGFRDSANATSQTARLDDVRFMGGSPDYLIIQGNCSVEYPTEGGDALNFASGATGTLEVALNSPAGPGGYTIPQGTVVLIDEVPFITTEDLTIPEGQPSGQVPIESVGSGSNTNLPASAAVVPLEPLPGRPLLSTTDTQGGRGRPTLTGVNFSLKSGLYEQTWFRRYL